MALWRMQQKEEASVNATIKLRFLQPARSYQGCRRTLYVTTASSKDHCVQIKRITVKSVAGFVLSGHSRTDTSMNLGYFHTVCSSLKKFMQMDWWWQEHAPKKTTVQVKANFTLIVCLAEKNPPWRVSGLISVPEVGSRGTRRPKWSRGTRRWDKMDNRGSTLITPVWNWTFRFTFLTHFSFLWSLTHTHTHLCGPIWTSHRTS